MFQLNWKRLGVITGLSLSLVAAGCGQDSEGTNSSGEGEGSETEKSVGEQIEYTLTGIEPGAGISEATDNALEEYENLEGWEHDKSSTAAMLTSLDNAIKDEKPVIVAGWSPHFMFAKWDLKYLDDPKGVYGGVERIQTIARKGLKEDKPKAYKILDRFQWDPSDMESVMLDAQEMDFDEAAQNWVDDNQDKVSEWTDGIDSVDGTELELVSTPWDTERSSANVAKVVLEEKGFEVTITAVSPSIMFEAVAAGDGDASLSPWMPQTHGAFYEDYKDDFEDLGKNLEGAKIGLVVPSYMDIESIEDLQSK